MYLERHQRKDIKDKKKRELKNAQEELFADLDEVNENDIKLRQQNKDDAQRNELREALGKLADEAETLSKEQQYTKTIGQDIFTSEDIVDAKGDKNFTTYKADEKIG